MDSVMSDYKYLEAYWKGQAAANKGEDYTDNPYADEELSDAWLEGLYSIYEDEDGAIEWRDSDQNQAQP